MVVRRIERPWPRPLQISLLAVLKNKRCLSSSGILDRVLVGVMERSCMEGF